MRSAVSPYPQPPVPWPYLSIIVISVVRQPAPAHALSGAACGARLAVDGQFAPKTKAAVIAFQRAMSTQVRGFAVDGIVGPLTWQALVTEALSG